MLSITYNALGVKLTGSLQVCDRCARSKEKSRKFRKKTYNIALHPGEKFFVDTTGPFLESFIGNRYCIGILDGYSHYSWSLFMKTKSQLPNKMEEFFQKIISLGTPVKYLCCDNAGETQSKLQKACKKEKVALKYTTPNTNQSNSVIERRLSVIK